jgi:hypothetical protein
LRESGNDAATADEERIAMKQNPENLAGSPASIPWQQTWQESYACDMPTCVPYPRAPLSVLLEQAARRFPRRMACTLYGRGTTSTIAPVAWRHR